MRGIAIKLSVSVAFSFLALQGLGAGDIAHVLADISPAWVAAACAVLLVSHAISSVRWWVLLQGQGLDVPLVAAVRLNFIGLFFTNVLPSGFGGDAVRTWVLGKESDRLSDVAASVLVDRIAAVWALMALGLAALFVVPGGVPGEVAVAMAFSAAVVAAGSAFLLTRRPLQLVARYGRPALLRRVAGAAGTSLGPYRERHDLLLAAFALSLAGQVCVVTAASMLARALGLDVDPLLLACTIPVALLATAVPTSINGLGVREATFRALLVPAGVAAEDAIAFSLLTVVAGCIVSLPGAVAWVLARRSAPVLDGAPVAP